MNIFYLDHDVTACAQMHNDKHVVKMILEYAQLLSTAHRVLDGVMVIPTTGRKTKRWDLSDPVMNENLYKATHINHPSAVWARQSNSNYTWLYSLFISLLQEYTYRYGKQHACEKLIPYLAKVPENIPNKAFTQPTTAMPDHYKTSDSIESYRNYYRGDKQKMANWKNRIAPEWWA